jgi:GNAT superfamily N-acetyltransferase
MTTPRDSAAGAGRSTKRSPPSPYLVTSRPTKAARRTILNGLVGYNRERFGLEEWRRMGNLRRRPLAVLLRDGRGRVQGGIVGETFWGWAYIQLFWLPQAMRGHGHGTRLMQLAEAEARKRACIGMRLDTASFQAPDFYPKLGFELCGAIDDFPPGHRHYYYIKRLAP